MSVEAFAAPRQLEPFDAWENAKTYAAKVGEQTITRLNKFATRAPSETIAPTSFDLQFDAKRLLVSTEFPTGVTYSFAKPDQSKGKPLVVVACGVQEPPDEIKEFMRLLVDNGWPIVSIYDFKHTKGLLPDDVHPSVIKQQALANKQVLEEVMETEDIDRFHAFGHSKGGLVAAFLAGVKSEHCISYTGYAAAGMTDEISPKDMLAMAQKRTTGEIVYNLKNAIKHPWRTYHDTRGAMNMKLYPMLPWIRKLGVKTHGIFGDEDPLIPKDRLILLPEDAENRQFDELVFLQGTRHSDLVEKPKDHIGLVMRLFNLAEVNEMRREKREETVVYAHATV